MTEQEISRRAARRLAIIRHAQEVTGNVALTCRYYGVSRQVFYIWLRRYEQLGLEGLRDRSRRSLVSPTATKAEVVGKILYLRQNCHFGPARISMYLKRYHDVAISASGVWRILVRAKLNRLPSLTPASTARRRPSLVRAVNRSRSNSARPPRTASSKRPCGVVVSA